MAIYQPGVPDAHASGYADLSQARLAEDPNVDGEVIRQVPMAAGDPQRDRQRPAPRDLRAGHQQRPVPQHHRREPLPLLPVERHPDRRQDRHRPGRGQLSVERLVGVRRVQHRSRPGPTRSPPTSRRPDTVRRPPGLWSNACSCSCPATPTPTRSCCPTSSTRRRTSPPNRGSLSDTSCFNGRFGATTGRRVSGHGHLVPVPQAGFGAREHRRQPRGPEPQHRLGADVRAGRRSPSSACSSSSRRRGPASPPTRTRSSPVRSSSRSSR